MEKSKVITLKHTKSIEVDPVEAGNFVAQVLQEDFEFISKEINEMRGYMGSWTSAQTHDWNNNMEVRDAMKTLMRYYMTHKEYKEFMELQRCYGNVV
jgi:hypothetical protein